jgi:hypothetical protein
MITSKETAETVAPTSVDRGRTGAIVPAGRVRFPAHVESDRGMQVGFYKADEGRLCGWTAAPPKRKRFQGTTMASGRTPSARSGAVRVRRLLGWICGFWGSARQRRDLQECPGASSHAAGRRVIRAHARGSRGRGSCQRACERLAVGRGHTGGCCARGDAPRWRALPVNEVLLSGVADSYRGAPSRRRSGGGRSGSAMPMLAPLLVFTLLYAAPPPSPPPPASPR